MLIKDSYTQHQLRSENELKNYPKEKALLYILLSDHKQLLTGVKYYHNLEAKAEESKVTT